MWRLRMKNGIWSFACAVCERIYGRAPEKTEENEHWFCTQEKRYLIHKPVQAEVKVDFNDCKDVGSIFNSLQGVSIQIYR